MSTTDYWVSALSCSVLTWLLLAAYTLGDRLRHDRALRRLTGRPGQATASDDTFRAQEHERILGAARFATRHSLETVVVDNTQPDWLRSCLALLILARYGQAQVLRDARRGAWHRSRWRAIVAWEVLYHAGAGDLHGPLRAGIRDSDPMLSNAAATMLGQLGDQGAARILVDALRANVCAPRLLAIQLERFAESDRVEAVLPLLADADGEMRGWGVALLSGCLSVERLDLRLALLADDDHPGVRKAVAEAMGRIGNALARSVLVKLLHDRSGFVRANAVRALHRASMLSGAPDLLLELPALQNDNDWWVRLAVREALAFVRQPPAALTQPAPYDDSGAGRAPATRPALERLPS